MLFTYPITALSLLYRFFSFSFLLLLVFQVSSQNLVPNPSFEDFENGCPINFNEMPIGWNKWRSSPNSFSTCVIPGNLIDSLGWAPWNGFGFQEPAEGESYVGLSAFSPSPKPGFDPEYREYIGCELIEPLEVGITYYVSFKTSLGFAGSYYNVTWACNKLGALFTMQAFGGEGNELATPNMAHVYTEEIITDTLNWVVISGSFVADQPYTHMGLGVFFDYNLLNTLEMIPGLSLGSYYFIDEVCVSTSPTCSSIDGNAELCTSLSKCQFWPNPANETIRIRTGLFSGLFSILSLDGEIIKQQLIDENTYTSMDIQGLPSGTYIIQLTSQQTIHREKLVVVH